MTDTKKLTPPVNTDGLFLPYQQRWLDDASPLKIIEKSRQIGITYVDSCDSVFKAAAISGADVYVASRDENAAIQYLEQCKCWARALNYLAEDLGARLIHSKRDIKAYVLKFASGWCIYCLSSHPDALAGKHGHIKLDEFALHKDQLELYTVAKGCIQWGFQLSIISTHRGATCWFNQLLREIKEQGNPKRWSHHRVTLRDAVAEGLVDRINAISGANETPTQFLERIRRESVDQEHYDREYDCQPADENTAFLNHELITGCETSGCLKHFEYLEASQHPLYIGMDVARKKHLCVIDVGEKIGDVIWDRLRLEYLDKTFTEIEDDLYRILKLSNVKRCCIDATGMGIQLSERAKDRFKWKVEPVNLSAPVKEELAYDLLRAFEDRRLRIDSDPRLRADLRGVKKLVTIAGNIRFAGDTDDSHCDRFWAKALRQHAARTPKGNFKAYLV